MFDMYIYTLDCQLGSISTENDKVVGNYALSQA